MNYCVYRICRIKNKGIGLIFKDYERNFKCRLRILGVIGCNEINSI